MDDRAVNQYLSGRGMQQSAKNASAVRNHYASNPDLMERRALGLPGGLDDNSAILDAMLDKHIADTSPTPAGTVEVGQPQLAEDKSPPPSRTGPAVRGKGDVGGSKPVATGRPGGTTWEGASENQNLGPLPARDASAGERGAVQSPVAQMDPATYGVDPQTSALSPAGGAANPNIPSASLMEWLLPLLGVSAAVPAAARQGMLPNGRAQLALPAPQARIEDGTPRGNYEDVGNDMETINQRKQAGKTQQRAQVKEDVDAENDAMTRHMEDEARKARAQKGASETVKQAKRVFRK